MSPDAVLRELRAAGVQVGAENGSVRLRTAPGTLPEPLRQAAAAVKPELLRLLQAETQELKSLADRCGRQMEFLEEHSAEWTDAEWVRRRNIVAKAIDTLLYRLAETGRTLPEFGWVITPTGQWHRVGCHAHGRSQ